MKKKISLMLLGVLCLSIIGCGKNDSTEPAKETVTATPTQEAQKGKITSAPVSDEKESTDSNSENTENTEDSDTQVENSQQERYSTGGWEEWLGTFAGDNSYTLYVDSAFQLSDDGEGEAYLSYTIEGEDLSYSGSVFPSADNAVSAEMRFDYDSDGITVTQLSGIEGVPAGTLDGYYKRQ